MAGSQWETKMIDTENASVTGTDISGEYIVFLTSGEKMDNSGNRIHLNKADSGDSKITGVPSDKMTVTGEDVSGDYAVWFETQAMDFETNESDTLPNSIYLMDIGDNNTEILDLPGDAEWPKLYGDNVFWSNQSGDSFETNFNLYSIPTGRSEIIVTKDCIDPTGIVFDNGNIAYQDQKDLRIYNIKSGRETIVFESEYTNESGSNVESFDMAGDYLIYLKHTTVFEGEDKGIYYQPCLYTISSGDTILLNPKTGEISESFTKDDKKVSISSPFTDGKRVGWGYLKSETGSRIIIRNPDTGNTTIKITDGTIDNIRLDGNRMVWTVSHFPSFHSSLVYAEENVQNEDDSTPSAPGFSFFTLFESFLILTIIYIRKQK